MKTDLDVIMRRLAKVPPVKGDVRAPRGESLDGPGVSRYQRRSAHLRTRDCSVDLIEFDVVDVDLTKE